MVRITDNRMITNDGKHLIEAYGLSTDTKPTEKILQGSIFIEIDTSNVYWFNEASNTWVKAGGT